MQPLLFWHGETKHRYETDGVTGLAEGSDRNMALSVTQSASSPAGYAEEPGSTEWSALRRRSEMCLERASTHNRENRKSKYVKRKIHESCTS